MAKEQKAPPVQPQPSGVIPQHVVLHIKSLLDTIQPGAGWTPQNLRSHADSKEIFNMFAKQLTGNKPTTPAGEKAPAAETKKK